MKEIFERIYAENAWGHGSGEGSLPEHTAGYVAFLARFLRRNGITSVVDLGCGDWQFSRFVPWQGIRYLGIDIVEPVIRRNRERFQAANLSFELADAFVDGLPQADLFIVKDVLQHWSYGAIRSFLPSLDRFPLALVTNCVNPHGPTTNRDIEDGAFRPLDLALPPFSLELEKVYSFTNDRGWLGPLRRPRWRKVVYLHRRGGTSAGVAPSVAERPRRGGLGVR